MRILTYFDDKLWDQHSKSWRRLNTKVLNPIVFYLETCSLKEEISGAFPTSHSCGAGFSNLCESLLGILEKGETYLFVSSSRPPLDSSELVESYSIPSSLKGDFFCKTKSSVDINLKLNLTSSILNLKDRVETIKLIEEKNDSVLDASLVLGTYDFWVGFIGFQKHLINNSYLNPSNEYYPDLALNLFYQTSSSFSAEIQK